jgi:hypothetical protein
MISLNNPSFSANSDDEGYAEEEEVDRDDEVKEVRSLSSKDTTRIRFWRLIVNIGVAVDRVRCDVYN